MLNNNVKLNMRWITAGGMFAVFIITLLMTVGINDLGYRTVVQWPDGTKFVKFENGWYMAAFGTTKKYPDVLTFDYDKDEDTSSSINQAGIAVRYQDGGLGTIYGKDRFALPTDEETMLNLHKAFRSPEGLANKLLKTLTEEAINQTAGLMTSEDAYAKKRGEFRQLTKIQISKGLLKTELKNKLVKGVDGKEIWEDVPVIYEDPKTKQRVHLKSDLADYDIKLLGHQITDWDFEGDTIKQIKEKRKATMAIITAKANAERAKQDAITTEEQGKANVMEAKYEQEVEKEKAVVVALREKEVATIDAQRKVEVAAQAKLEMEQKKFAAAEYKQQQILLGEGDSEYKRLVMEADNALAQKLEAEMEIHRYWANAYANRKVPTTVFGSGVNGTGAPTGSDGEVKAFMQMLTVDAAKRLNYSREIQTTSK